MRFWGGSIRTSPAPSTSMPAGPSDRIRLRPVRLWLRTLATALSVLYPIQSSDFCRPPTKFSLSCSSQLSNACVGANWQGHSNKPSGFLQPQLAAGASCRHGHTMRFGSTAQVLLKCKLKYYRISEWGIPQKAGAAAGGQNLMQVLDTLDMRQFWLQYTRHSATLELVWAI